GATVQAARAHFPPDAGTSTRERGNRYRMNVQTSFARSAFRRHYSVLTAMAQSAFGRGNVF
ncbi:MAG: hypothetical protein ACLGP3_12060, partial [Acidobacteriota bacterium]